MVRDLFCGAASIPRAVRLLRAHPRLRRLAVRPFLVNALLFVVGVPVAVWLATSWAADLVTIGGGIGAALRFLLEIIVAVGVTIATAVLLILLGGVVASPFNARLSEEVERTLSADSSVAVDRGTTRGTVRDLFRGLMMTAGRFLIFLLLYPPILLTQFIPVVGVLLYPTLTFLYAAYLLAFDLSEEVLDRNFSSFRANVAVIATHKMLYLGFGSAMILLISIPVLNLLALPIGVTAATTIFLEDVRRSGNPVRKPLGRP